MLETVYRIVCLCEFQQGSSEVRALYFLKSSTNFRARWKFLALYLLQDKRTSALHH